VSDSLTSMKEAIEMIRNGAMGNLLGLLGIFIKEITKLTRETVMVKCIGRTELSIKDNG
jgi:hypothetical protein